MSIPWPIENRDLPDPPWEADYDEDDDTECGTCDGSGEVFVIDTQTLDRGSRWQRTDQEEVAADCPECNGGIWQ